MVKFCFKKSHKIELELWVLIPNHPHKYCFSGMFLPINEHFCYQIQTYYVDKEMKILITQKDATIEQLKGTNKLVWLRMAGV